MTNPLADPSAQPTWLPRGLWRAATALTASPEFHLATFGFLYFGGVAIGCALIEPGSGARSIWPASGVGLAALLVSSRRRWPALLALMFASTVAARVIDGRPLLYAAFLATPAPLEALTGALLFARVIDGPVAFRRVNEVILLAAFASIGCGAIGVLAAALASWTAGGVDPLQYWQVWWTADALGVLLVTPLVVAWIRPDPPPQWRRIRYSETAAFSLLWGCALVLVFIDTRVTSAGASPSLLYPLLAWAGLRLGIRGSTLALTVLAVVMVMANLALDIQSSDGFFGLQLFLAAATLTTILLAASLSERRAAEAALSARDYRHRMLLAGLPVAVYTTDINGYLTSYNQAAADLWGRLPALFRERWCGSFRLLTADGETLPHHDGPTAKALTTNTAVRAAECQLARMNGTTVPFMAYATPLRNTSGQMEGAMNVMVDITERKRVETATLDVNARYARQADALNALTRLAVTDAAGMSDLLRVVAESVAHALDLDRVSVWRLTKHGHALSCQELYERRSGRHSFGQELLKQDSPSYFDALAKADPIATSRPDGDPRTIELRDRYLTPNGITAMVDAPIHSGGEPVGVLCCEHAGDNRFWAPDEQTFAVAAANVISALIVQAERHLLEQQLRESQKLEAIGQLAGGIAHDFNNLLTVIISEGVDLQIDERLPDHARAAAREIVRSSDRAANLTRQLLTFSRRQAMRPRAVDLNVAVTELSRMLRRLLGQHVAVECLYAPGALTVHADAGMLDQVMMNLAINARDAMAAGGQLTIETRAVRIGEDDPCAGDARPGSFVCLSITDTGAGIAAEHLPHIFEPFFSTKAPGKGTGLGLATTYGIVRQHQGWIDVETAVGRGTTFRVFLPKIVGDADGAPADDASLDDAAETILLVDEDPALRAMIRNHLVDGGFVVIEAGSGEEALDLCESQASQIRLLITDIVLPGETTGVVLARRLQERRPGLKVLYTWSYRGDVAGTGWLLRGQPNVLAKPFMMHALAEAVGRCLEQVDAPPER